VPNEELRSASSGLAPLSAKTVAAVVLLRGPQADGCPVDLVRGEEDDAASRTASGPALVWRRGGVDVNSCVECGADVGARAWFCSGRCRMRAYRKRRDVSVTIQLSHEAARRLSSCLPERAARPPAWPLGAWDELKLGRLRGMTARQARSLAVELPTVSELLGLPHPAGCGCVDCMR